ncbi:hypothetical protein DFAR_3320002 [Desulfarculales bacterium]
MPVAETGYVNIYGMDITERKRVEEFLRVLATFPDENPNPVLRISSQGTGTYANQACRLSLGDQNCQKGQPAPLHPGV